MAEELRIEGEGAVRTVTLARIDLSERLGGASVAIETALEAIEHYPLPVVAADEMVVRLASNAPLSLRAMKATLVRAMAVRSGIEHADVDELIARAAGSEDAREGMRARLEKRPAEFRGR